MTDKLRSVQGTHEKHRLRENRDRPNPPHKARGDPCNHTLTSNPPGRPRATRPPGGKQVQRINSLTSAIPPQRRQIPSRGSLSWPTASLHQGLQKASCSNQPTNQPWYVIFT
eukprot:sb/3477045/